MLKAVMFFGAIVLIGGLVIGSVLLRPVTTLPPAPTDHNDTYVPINNGTVPPPVNNTNDTIPLPPVNVTNETIGEYEYTGHLDWVAWPGPKYDGQPGPDYCLVVFNMMNRTYYGDGEAYWEGTNISFCDKWASEACSNLQGYVGQYITLIYNVTEEGIRFGGVR